MATGITKINEEAENVTQPINQKAPPPSAKRRVPALTLDQIEIFWELYHKATMLKVLEAGEWKYHRMTPGAGLGNIRGTKAEIVKLKDVITFPEYLREKLKKVI